MQDIITMKFLQLLIFHVPNEIVIIAVEEVIGGSAGALMVTCHYQGSLPS